MIKQKLIAFFSTTLFIASGCFVISACTNTALKNTIYQKTICPLMPTSHLGLRFAYDNTNSYLLALNDSVDSPFIIQSKNSEQSYSVYSAIELISDCEDLVVTFQDESASDQIELHVYLDSTNGIPLFEITYKTPNSSLITSSALSFKKINEINIASLNSVEADQFAKMKRIFCEYLEGVNGHSETERIWLINRCLDLIER